MTPETEDQLRQYFRDATATVDGRPDLVGDVVHAGKRRLRRRRSAVVGAAVAASLGIALVVPIIQSANDPGPRDSSPAATATVQPLPHISTWTRRPAGWGGQLMLSTATVELSSDGRCLVASSERLLVWPAGYSLALRAGHITVLDETGAEAARVGDHIEAGTYDGDPPANNPCGLSSALYIDTPVTSTRP